MTPLILSQAFKAVGVIRGTLNSSGFLETEDCFYLCNLSSVIENYNLPTSTSACWVVQPETLKKPPYIILHVLKEIKKPDYFTNDFTVRGRVIYQNKNHQFLLVRVNSLDSTSAKIIKLNGVISDGRAINKSYTFTCKLETSKLVITKCTELKKLPLSRDLPKLMPSIDSLVS